MTYLRSWSVHKTKCQVEELYDWICVWGVHAFCYHNHSWICIADGKCMCVVYIDPFSGETHVMHNWLMSSLSFLPPFLLITL